MTVLIEVPGVLRTDTGDPVDGVIIPVRSMLSQVRVVFCSEVSNDELFLLRESITGYASFRNNDVLTALMKERTLGNVDLVITPSTYAAREIHKQGISVMVSAASRAVNPEWRPEKRGWAEVMGEFDG